MRRSRKKLDLEEIEQLAFRGCTVREIAMYLGRDEAALEKSSRCIHAIGRGWVRRLIILRHRMFELAVRGNINLLMFLHDNPPPLNALCAAYEELKEKLRLRWITAERKRWELRGWGDTEAGGSDGTQSCEGVSSQSPE
jgi:hypothetical protein